MESGFGQNLEGFLIKGNLSVIPAELPISHGDGSLEGSGTLYFNNIKEYDVDNGINIQNVVIKNNQIYIPYTEPSRNTTTASFIIEGGISIKNTTNSTSVTSGGSLTVAGGASFGKNVNIGGIVNVNNNNIINVQYPVQGTDAVNKNYVDFVAGKVSGNFTRGQIIIADSNGDSIRGFDFFTTDTTNVYVDIPIVLSNDLHVGGDTLMEGILDLSNNIISNVAYPVNDSDVATKGYVDSITITQANLGGTFLSNEVLVGMSSGSSIGGFPSFTFDGSVLTLGTTATTGSFVLYGSATIQDGTLDVNGNIIENVGTPTNPTDAASKQYVDNALSSITTGNVGGNFTSGQVLVADTNGTSIRGFDDLTFNFNNSTLTLSSSASLYVHGETTLEGQVFLQTGLDAGVNRITNVDTPINDLDAVNKQYVDDMFADCCNGNVNGGGSFVTLNNGVIEPIDVPGFYYPEYTNAFISTVYVQYNQGKYALFTLYGYKCDGAWTILKTFVGDITNVDFDIRTVDNIGVLQYTNTNVTGSTVIQFTTTSQINQDVSGLQTNFQLNANASTPTPITELSFSYNSFQLVLYISSEIDSQCGMYLLSGVKHASTWSLHSHYFGDISNIVFSIEPNGVLYYINNNPGSDYVVRARKTEIEESLSFVTLLANTISETDIDTMGLEFSSTEYFFQLSILVEIEELQKSALYEIQGAFHQDTNTWKINSRFIGDYLNIRFSISSVAGNGRLQYTNANVYDAIIRYTKNTSIAFQPLSVSKGGTGNTYFNPYAILRGNGTDPIVATDDFIYQNYQLSLGESSSIYLNNTTNATSITNGGTLTSNGGASFAKDVFIGGELDVSINRIKNVHDPVEALDAVNKRYLEEAIENIDTWGDFMNNDPLFEHSLLLQNNVTTLTDIPDFCFDQNIKAFISNIYVSINDSNFALYTIRCINAGDTWMITSTLTGLPTGVSFYISNQGCVQYTNTNTFGICSIKYRTYTRVKDSDPSQLQSTLSSNVSIPQNIPGLLFLNSEVKCVKFVIYVSSSDANKYGLYLCSIVLKNNEWDLTCQVLGNINNIVFSIDGTIDQVQLQYTNTNFETDYTIRVQLLNILESEITHTLLANTFTHTQIDEIFFDNSNDKYFALTIYVYNLTLNKFALYEIQGFLANGFWSINTRYIGDYTGIRFNILTVNDVGYFTYTNENASDTFIKVVRDIPLTTVKPIPIDRGGTGNSYLAPYTVLRGNGVNPIIGSEDFIYRDNQLVLGNYSSILIQNTQETNSFVSYGGISVSKDLRVGNTLIVNNINITPSIGDIANEQTFHAANGIVSPDNVSGFQFLHPSVKSFTGVCCVTIHTIDDEFDCLFELKGLKKRTGWVLYSSNVGDDVGVSFSITNTGQIQYTSTIIQDWVSTIMKFKATTTSS